MRPTTRSMSVSKTASEKHLSNEKIHYTKDPCQITFESPQANLPYWRYVLYERYCGTYQPAGTSSVLKEFSRNNEEQLTIPPHFVSTLPCELWRSFTQVFEGTTKLLSISTYYTTGTIHVQGNVCQEWVEHEFDKLKCIVNQLVDLGPCTETASDVLQKVASPCRQPLLAINNETPHPPPPNLEATHGLVSTATTPALPPPSPSLTQESDQVPPPPTSMQSAVSQIDSVPQPPPCVSDATSPLPPPSSPTDLPPPNTTAAFPDSSESHVTSSSPPTAQTSPTHPHPQPTPHSKPNSCCEDIKISVPPSLYQHSNTATICLLHKQLISATLTISSLQTEIQSLKQQLSEISQQTEQNTQKIADTEVKVKNTTKQNMRDVTQQITELHDNHKNQQHQLKEISSKLHSFKDSQHTLNSSTKKQIQSLTTVKQTQHSDTQTDNTLTDPVPAPPSQDDYSVETSNRFSVLSDNNFNDSFTNTSRQTTSNISVTSHKQIGKQPPLTHNLKSTHSNSTSTRQIAPIKTPLIAHRPHTRSHSQPTPPHSNKQSYTTNNHNPPQPSPFTTLMQRAIPQSCDTLLLGDSVLTAIDEKKISTNREQVRNLSVPGLTVSQLCQWLTLQPPSPHIGRVTFHIGINSCNVGPVPTGEWKKLIQTMRKVFPNAVLHASSIIPPLGRHPLKAAASQSTANLRRSCEEEGVVFIDNTPFFLAKSGAPRKAMYRDKLHPSHQGCEFLVRNLRLRGNNHYPSPGHRPVTRHRPGTYADAITGNKGREEIVPFTTHVDGGNNSVAKHHRSSQYDYDNFPPTQSRNPNSSAITNVLGPQNLPVPDSQHIIRLLAEILKPHIN